MGRIEPSQQQLCSQTDGLTTKIFTSALLPPLCEDSEDSDGGVLTDSATSSMKRPPFAAQNFNDRTAVSNSKKRLAVVEGKYDDNDDNDHDDHDDNDDSDTTKSATAGGVKKCSVANVIRKKRSRDGSSKKRLAVVEGKYDDNDDNDDNDHDDHDDNDDSDTTKSATAGGVKKCSVANVIRKKRSRDGSSKERLAVVEGKCDDNDDNDDSDTTKSATVGGVKKCSVANVNRKKRSRDGSSKERAVVIEDSDNDNHHNDIVNSPKKSAAVIKDVKGGAHAAGVKERPVIDINHKKRVRANTDPEDAISPYRENKRVKGQHEALSVEDDQNDVLMFIRHAQVALCRAKQKMKVSIRHQNLDMEI
ncbi:MAG: hypothetical protein M1824_001079 [Vezdaea acicularis]|nr:MAG: hypothetical protein M1824_001079 [Vezdaea acicularis]